MARSQTMVQLTDDLVAELDTAAIRRGISRSALIREALDGYLVQLRNDEVGVRILAGYASKPPATPDAWSGLDRFGDVSTRELAQRLDEEERREGHDVW